jgi:hypothetical protein
MKHTVGIGKGTSSTASGDMLTVTDLLSWLEGLGMFRLGPVATGGKMNPSGNVSFTKRTWVE